MAVLFGQDELKCNGGSLNTAYSERIRSNDLELIQSESYSDKLKLT
ncbi:hypothetical protein ACLM5H_01620 [Fredinandcohnia humi]